MNKHPSRKKLIAPNGEKKILLHSCCAPCSGELIEAMTSSEFDVTLYYYNPNIYPKDEYEIRKNESRRFCEKMNIKFVEGEYENTAWAEKIKGYENEPERGKRCELCFDFRFDNTARYAHENGFKVFTSGLGISRWKDINKVTECGQRAAAKYTGIVYWDHNWRKDGGSQRMYEIAKRENFYKQKYCGCIYSLDQMNARNSNNKESENKHEYYKNE